MATMPERDPVKRVAVLVELESGATVAIYAQPDPAHNDALVDVQTRRQDPTMFRVDPEPPTYRVTVSGLHEYRQAVEMPATVNAVLDAIRNAVDL